MTHTNDLTAGARAMYEALPEFDKYEDGYYQWENLDQADRDAYIRAFALGLAAMPDHSAELVEALESLVEAVVNVGGLPEYGQVLKARAAIAKARARKGAAT